VSKGSFKQPKRWLITGGCGFIGSSLVQRLTPENDTFIRIVDNLSVGTRADLSRVCEFKEVDRAGLSHQSAGADGVDLPVELVVGDILDADLAMNVARDMDVIVHLAASTGVGQSVRDPRQDCMTNVIGTLNYLEAARKQNVPRFVFASSGAPVGECEPPVHEEMAPHPVSPYGASKLAGEAYCSAYFGTFVVETVCLRFGNVYGPGSKHKSSVVAKFIRRAMRSDTLEVYGDGEQTRDFIYIDDLIRAVCNAAEVKSVGGETFQIATSAETTVNELLEQLLAVLTAEGINGLRTDYGPARTGDMKRNFSDISKARDFLGWESTVDLQTGLRETVRWFLSGQGKDAF